MRVLPTYSLALFSKYSVTAGATYKHISFSQGTGIDCILSYTSNTKSSL